VPDIYKVLDEGNIEINTDDLAKMVEHRLNRNRNGNSYLRMSNFGKPDRQLWYHVNRPELAEPIPPWTRLKFLVGDIIEAVVLTLAKASGHKVTGEQSEMVFKGVKGSRDAVIDGMTIDVKSANSRSFQKFENHELDWKDPFHYRDQLDLYTKAAQDDPEVTEKDTYAFLAVDKEMGHIVLDTYQVREKDYEAEVKRKALMLAKTDPPERCYSDQEDGKSGNRKLCTECSYCPYKKTCWPGLRTFLYANGPRFLTRVMKEPDVPEVR
jgi:hypothetical protein